MKEKIVKLYEFEELPEDVQEKVLEKNRYINVEDFPWHDFTIDEWQDEKLPERGFDNAHISYSGFWSQGDGASFTAKVNIFNYLKFNKKTNKYRALYNALMKGQDEITIEIKRSGHYCHEFTMYLVDECFTENKKVETQFYILLDHVLADARKYAKEIYKELESEYDGLVTDEAVKDTILCNEYTFTIEGRMEHL